MQKQKVIVCIVHNIAMKGVTEICANLVLDCGFFRSFEKWKFL